LEEEGRAAKGGPGQVKDGRRCLIYKGLSSWGGGTGKNLAKKNRQGHENCSDRGFMEMDSGRIGKA